MKEHPFYIVGSKPFKGYKINGTLYRHNPHSHYALYQTKQGEWRESASVTNEMLDYFEEEQS